MNFKKNKQKTVFILAGGTGGHMFPAHAVAQVLGVKNNVVMITDKRGSEFLKQYENSRHYEIRIIRAAPLSGGLSKKIVNLLQITVGVWESMYYFMKYGRPNLVLAFGGYATFPPLVIALMTRVQIVLHEQNSSLGQVNRIFFRFAKLLLLSFSNTRYVNYDKKYNCKIEFTGNPVRKGILHPNRIINRDKVNRDKEICVLITGGSQGAQLFDNIANFISDLPVDLQKKLTIFHQAKANSIEHITEVYKRSHVKKYEVRTFFEDIGEKMRIADLLIARSGASTISEIAACKKPAILVPLASAKDNHQYYNAMQIVDAHAAIMLDEKDVDEEMKSVLYKLLSDKNKLERMAEAYNELTSMTNNSVNATQNIVNNVNKLL